MDFNTDNAKVEQALSELAAQVAAVPWLCGNCRIETSSYTGTGGKTQSIPFAHMPLFYVIRGTTASMLGVGGVTKAHWLGNNNNVFCVDCSWSGNTLSLASNTPSYCMNYTNEAYTVIAFSAM